MEVRIPTPLRSYVDEQASVTAEGDSVADVLDDLERQYPGIRFRLIDEQGQIRQHMRIFVNKEMATGLDHPLADSDVVTLMQALSGG